LSITVAYIVGRNCLTKPLAVNIRIIVEIIVGDLYKDIVLLPILAQSVGTSFDLSPALRCITLRQGIQL